MKGTPVVVTVRFFANVQIFMGKTEVTVTMDNPNEPTIGDVISEVSRLVGKDLKGMAADEHGSSLGAVRIVLGDRLLLEKPLDTKVKNGDTILVFPLLGGG